ncbi:MAG TPA: hypothetical protein VGJ95_20320 [Pseudonocardiaceae bacterium]|jgi:hypothetical protein
MIKAQLGGEYQRSPDPHVPTVRFGRTATLAMGMPASSSHSTSSSTRLPARRQHEGARVRKRLCTAALVADRAALGRTFPWSGSCAVVVSRAPLLVGVRAVRRRSRTVPLGAVCVTCRVADASQNRPLVLLGHQMVMARRLVSRL